MRRNAAWAVIGALISLTASLPATQQTLVWHPYADFLFTGGEVVTVNDSFSVAEALAVKDGNVIAVGSHQAVATHRGPDTRIIDIGGKTVIPGLQDSHIHFLGLGRDVTGEADLTFAESADDIIKVVADLSARLAPEPGAWLLGRRWDQYKYPAMVTRWQLDDVAPDNPVLLRRVYRGVAVNTAVFRMMGIDDDRPATWPDWWLRDPTDFSFEDRIERQPRQVTVDGEQRVLSVPTGVFLGSRASRLVTAQPPASSFEEDVRSVKTGAEEMLRLGVTAIIDPSSRMGYNVRVYQEAIRRGWLPLRVAAVYEGTFRTESPEAIRQHLDAIKINRLGDRFFRWQGTKYYSDGGSGSRSSWLSESFDRWEEYEGEQNLGIPVVADDDVREAQFRAALDYGWDLNTHNTGDQAMRQTVNLYMKLMDEIRQHRPDADLRWSVIHAYLPIEPRTMVLPDMRAYGIVAAPNPVFIWQLGRSFAINLGPQRVQRTQPFRSYVTSGVVMASGSDYGVAHHDPWLGFYALLTRRDQATGEVLGAEETVGIADALRSYTINGAYLTYDDDIRGSLEVGKLADLVVLDLPSIRDLEVDSELCFGMRDRVLLTMVEGKIAYQRD